MNETLKEDAWTKIFKDAGIDATDAAKYAKIFVAQKMSRVLSTSWIEHFSLKWELL